MVDRKTVAVGIPPLKAESPSPAFSAGLVAEDKENETELIFPDLISPTFFDLTGRIYIQRDNFERVLDKLSSEYGSHPSSLPVVSFLGDTKSGKSTLISELMRLQRPQDDGFPIPTVASRHQVEPTTANMQVYLSPEGVYMDFEGEEGGKPPVNDHQFELDPMHMKKYREMRRKAVKKHFPRVAYATSDVVIMVSVLEVGNNRLKEVVQEFAENSVQNVITPDKPFLIIVSNKQCLDPDSDRDEVSIETLTERFWESNDEDRHLLKFYSDVNFVSLPVVPPEPSEELKAKKPKKYEAEVMKREELQKYFGDRVGEIRQLLLEFGKTRMEQKHNIGILVNMRNWWKCFGEIVRNMNENLLRVSACVAMALLPDEEVGQKVIISRFTRILNHGCLSKDHDVDDAFSDALSYTVWACLALSSIRFKRETKDQGISNVDAAAINLVKKTHEKILKQCLNQLKTQTPCCYKSKNKQSIRCSFCFGDHSKGHNLLQLDPTSSAIYFGMKKFKSMFQASVKGMFGFESSTFVPPKDHFIDLEIFQKIVDDSLRNLEIAISPETKLTTIVATSWDNVNSLKEKREGCLHPNSAENHCSICMENECDIKLFCGHRVCGKCYKLCGSFASTHESTESMKTSNSISAKTCCFCNMHF